MGRNRALGRRRSMSKGPAAALSLKKLGENKELEKEEHSDEGLNSKPKAYSKPVFHCTWVNQPFSRENLG